jgi:MYXO-CTERM domain-containing protein
MAKVGTLVVGLTALLLGLGAFEAEARACGGCFTPTDNPTVVTDHRMIMTITPNESTLYDQIKYTGDPASFAWVLPYAGDIQVGLSADIVFTSIDSLTQTNILPPPGCGNFGYAAGAGSSGTSGATSGGTSGGNDSVTVLKHEVVGPYDTVQLAATNPKALEEWLQTNNFNIPADVKPVVDQYVNEKFNFLALKLLPAKGIQDMRPVRVTTRGSNVALPLRMVAAGTGANVGISLWVISEGRYEPQNYGSFIINDNDLGWDVANAKSNYTDVRAALNAKGNNSVWEIESSIFLNGNQFESLVRYGSGYYGSSGASGGYDSESQAQLDYLPVKDASGHVTKTAVQVRQEDLDLLVPGDVAATRVTRMRADLAHSALTRDLVLAASQDQSLLSNTHQLFRCGLPTDPNSSIIRPGDPNAPIPAVTPPPKDQVTVGGGNGACAASATGGDRSTFSTIGFSVLGLALARLIRRRRQSAA